jgi:hypothetical protein
MALGTRAIGEQQRRTTVVLCTFTDFLDGAIDKTKDFARESLSNDIQTAAKFPKN